MALTTRRLAVEGRTDEQLIALATGGDKQAYGLLVKRYQNLVCSLAYCECGDFSQSEDLAQETFVAAWKNLAGLRDPVRFRAWLCGIARNLVASHVRKSKRTGAGTTLPLDAVAEPSSTQASPEDSIISREEESLIWHSLENIPETYRTPLILFYRQDQSVNEVALSLDLTPEATRQRLSRARALLREKVAGLVERTLSGSRPGKSFTIAALAALPALGTKATAASVAVTAAKGATLVKSAATLTLWGAILGPVLGVLGGYLGTRMAMECARSPRERRFMVRMSWLSIGLTIAFATCLILLILGDELFASLLIALIISYIVGTIGMTLWANRRLKTIFEEEQARDALYPEAPPMMRDRPRREYKSRATLLGIPLVHVAFGGVSDGVPKGAKAIGWIAIGDISFGVLLSIGGVAVGGIAIGGIACGVFALAGVATGIAVLGGFACGWMAAGGLAVAWHAAFGGLAIAMNYSLGGLAIANEANSDAARAFLANNPLMTGASVVMDHSRWFLLLAVMPILVALRARKSKS